MLKYINTIVIKSALSTSGGEGKYHIQLEKVIKTISLSANIFWRMAPLDLIKYNEPTQADKIAHLITTDCKL